MYNLPENANINDVYINLKNGGFVKFDGENFVGVSKFEAVKSQLQSGDKVLFNLLDSYRLKDGRFSISYETAKENLIERFREARKPLLLLLDIEYLKADETGNSQLKQEIATKKQVF